jgi:hypothetical protein
MQRATQFLGLSISKSNWQQRLDIDKLLAGKLRYGSDSYVIEVFDNLGYDRKGGPLKSKRYETVVQSLKEFSWPDTAPTLPQEWHTDTQKTEPQWAQPLTNWTVPNINKTLKPRLCAMLAEARAVLVKSGAMEVEARPQVDASARLQIDADSLTTALAAHPLILPLPSAIPLNQGWEHSGC